MWQFTRIKCLFCSGNLVRKIVNFMIDEDLPWQIEQVELGIAQAERGEFATVTEMQEIFVRYA